MSGKMIARVSSLPAMALALAMLMPLQPARADNCVWAGGTGNFNNKNKWINCRPGKKDNAEIGALWLNPPTGIANVTQKAEMHRLTVNAGSTVNVYYSMNVHGNDFVNNGTLNVINNGIISHFWSHSKNLFISGRGTINLFDAELRGNMTILGNQLVRGAGNIGQDADRLFNDGTIQADRPGKEILFARAIDGTGTFRSQSGGRLHFTADSSSDRLINNGSLQIDGGNFYVARDYQNAAFGRGNSFNARANVLGGGQIFAADAGQAVSGAKVIGNTVLFGAMRVGGQSTTSLVISNTGGLTTLRGAVQDRDAFVQVTTPDFVLAPGASQTSGLTFNGTTAGSFFRQSMVVVNNFANVADTGLFIQANVYAPAVAAVASRTIDFGTVRKGTAGIVAGTTIRNAAAAAALNDALRTSIGATPFNIGLVSAPGLLQAGASGLASFSLDTGGAGRVSGSTRLGFASANPEMADLALPAQILGFTGTITDPAAAALAKQSGDGILTGGGTDYMLDLGKLLAWSGTISTEIAILNTVFGSAFSETLGGSFTSSGGAGYSFLGDAFTGLAGGSRHIGNWLRFNTDGLAGGTYQTVLTFNGYSRYAGLGDLALAPIRLTISANVAGVPEPASWSMMILGFGLIGTMLRTRARRVLSVSQ